MVRSSSHGRSAKTATSAPAAANSSAFHATGAPVAGDQRTFAGKRQEDWQPRQCLHARRMRRRGILSVLDRGHQYTSC